MNKRLNPSPIQTRAALACLAWTRADAWLIHRGPGVHVPNSTSTIAPSRATRRPRLASRQSSKSFTERGEHLHRKTVRKPRMSPLFDDRSSASSSVPRL